MLNSYIVYNGQIISLTIKNDVEGEWKMMTIVLNNTDQAAQIEIKSQYDLPEKWVILADAAVASDEAIADYDKDDQIPPKSAMVLVDKESYEKYCTKDAFEQIEDDWMIE